MKLVKLSAVALAAIAMSAIATATHSTSPCNTQADVIDAGVATLYTFNEANGFWVYLESNGHAGPQRGGAAWYELGTGNGVDDQCWDRDATGEQIPDPDMIIL